MGDFGIDVKLNESVKKQLERYFVKTNKSIDKALSSALNESRDKFIEMLARNAPRKTGKLRSTIRSLRRPKLRRTGGDLSDRNLVVEIPITRRKDRIIIWTNYGTGIYGPSKTPIVPIESPFLVFKIGRRWIRARSVRGQKPKRFIEKTLRKFKPILNSKISEKIRGI